MGKKVIRYEFCDGTVSEVEVSDALFAVHKRIDKRIENDDRRETRRHNSLEQLAERRDTEIIDGRVDVETDYIKSEKKLLSIKAVKVKNGKLFPIHRGELLGLTDLEIITTYNAELRGICNFYNMASNYTKLSYFAFLMEYSCLKTLCSKHRIRSIRKLIKLYRDHKGGWGIPYETKNKKRRMTFAKFMDCKKELVADDKITTKTLIFKTAVSTFEERLKKKVCELCGSEDSEEYEIHHVNKVKNLKGKELWERVMIAKRRKTLVLCKDCHLKVHGKTKKSSE